MNNILKQFGEAEKIKLIDNEETVCLVVGDDFENDGSIPEGISEVLATSVSTDDNRFVTLVHNENNEIYKIQVTDQNGNCENYKFENNNFVKF